MLRKRAYTIAGGERPDYWHDHQPDERIVKDLSRPFATGRIYNGMHKRLNRHVLSAALAPVQATVDGSLDHWTRAPGLPGHSRIRPGNI